MNQGRPVNYTSISNLEQGLRGGNAIRVLVAGFFCARNLGDELMLESLIENIRERHIDITILGSDTDTPRSALNGDYTFIRQPTSRSELKRLVDIFDCLVIPGGALIDDIGYDASKSIHFGTIVVDLPYYFYKANKPYALFGLSSVKRLSNQRYISRLAKIIDNASSFSLRDTFSKESLKLSGVVTADSAAIVHDITYAHPVLNNFSRRPIKRRKHSIGLIYVFDDNTYPHLVAFTKNLLATVGPDSTLKIIPFYDYLHNDMSRARQLIDEIADVRLSLYPKFPGTFKDLIDALQSVDGIISMRYHGVLIGNFLGCSVVCIDYDTHTHYHNKNLYLYEHYKFPRHIIKYSQIDHESVAVEEMSKMVADSQLQTHSIHKQAAKQVQHMLTNLFKGVER